MKTITAIPAIGLMSAVSLFAQEITTDTTWEGGGTRILQTQALTIGSDNEAETVTLTVNYTGATDFTPQNSTLTIKKNGILTFTGDNATIKTEGNTTFDIAGKLNLNTGVILADNVGNFTFNLRDGAYMQMSSAAGNKELNFRRGVTNLTFEKGSTATGFSTVKIADRGDSAFVGTFNFNGSFDNINSFKIGENDSFLTNGRLGAATVNFGEGGRTSIGQNLEIAAINNFTGTVTIKGAGTVVATAQDTRLGASGKTGNMASLTIESGAQLSTRTVYFEYGNSEITLKVNDLSDVQTALIKTTTDLRFGDAGGKIVIEIDSSLADFGYESGDVLDIVLIDLGSSIYVNGAFTNKAALTAMDEQTLADFLGEIMTLDFSGNEHWAAADLGDITYNDGKFVLGLNSISSIPEPGVYALMFGALSLALAAYGRRK